MGSKAMIRGGHTETSTGASSLLNELEVDRGVYAEVIKNLRSLGETVYDGTPPESYSYPAELNYGIQKCNDNCVDYGASIHLNSGGGTGAEVWISENASSETVERASRVLTNLIGLGFNSRGIKRNNRDGRNLGEIRLTNCPFLIIEICFVDSKVDKELVDRLGYKAIGKAIAEGLTGKRIVLDGWVRNTNNQWEYYKDGLAQTGWIKDKQKWYFLESSGVMQTGWILFDNEWYFLDTNGVMQTGWVSVNGAWYYLKESGAMLKTEEFEKYTLSEEGKFMKRI